DFLNHLLRCRTGKERVETDLRLVGKDKKPLPVRLSSSYGPSLIRDGEILFQTVIFDLRERISAEAQLRAREERYRTLFELVPIAVYACDAKGFIQNFNRRAATLWGRQPDRNGTRQKYCGAFRLYYPDGTPMPPKKSPMARILRGEKLG